MKRLLKPLFFVHLGGLSETDRGRTFDFEKSLVFLHLCSLSHPYGTADLYGLVIPYKTFDFVLVDKVWC